MLCLRYPSLSALRMTVQHQVPVQQQRLKRFATPHTPPPVPCERVCEGPTTGVTQPHVLLLAGASNEAVARGDARHRHCCHAGGQREGAHQVTTGGGKM